MDSLTLTKIERMFTDFGFDFELLPPIESLPNHYVHFIAEKRIAGEIFSVAYVENLNEPVELLMLKISHLVGDVHSKMATHLLAQPLAEPGN